MGANEIGKTNGKGQLTRGERLQIMLTPEELEAVDNFRFGNRMPSRAASVRELFRLGCNRRVSKLLRPMRNRNRSEFLATIRTAVRRSARRYDDPHGGTKTG